ncbi:TonB family protein [Sulfurimonas sp.]|uniref:TonB family protein n=1 Tax=Sulfurimonas sp. TaxID=2022749 RepID=UPI003D1295BB
MRRYLSSFMITFLVYCFVVVSFVMALTEDDVKIVEKNLCVNKVAIAIIQQQCHAKKVQPKKEVKKVEQKPKKVVKKTKPKPVVKEVVKKEVPKEEVVEEIVQEEVVEEVVEHEEVVDNQELQRKMQQMKIAKEKELDRFTIHLIKKINENKRYPMSARRRGIEGDVAVKFVVMADGGVGDIKVLDGKKIFKKPTFKAIKDSFPVDVSNTLLDLPHEFEIKLVYQLVNQ